LLLAWRGRLFLVLLVDPCQAGIKQVTVRMWQYLSRIETETREQRVYRCPSGVPQIELTSGKGVSARVFIGDRVFDIKSTGNLFWPKFALFEGDERLWNLASRSLFRNSYVLKTSASDEWCIKTPFFNVSVSGTSIKGPSLEGCIARFRNEWLFSFSGIEPSPDLVVAVAFLHRFSYFHV
jgi:hypothetical protein